MAVQLDPTDAPSPWVSPSQNSLVTRFFLGSCKTYSEPSGCIQECITILYYESQPKAWAEYRYKAKLIQGVWGARASDLGHFGKVESRIVRRNAQKGVGHPFGVLKLEREELRET